MSFKLCSIGDVMLGENVHHFNRGIIKRFYHDYKKLLSPAAYDSISRADILLFNLESGIASEDVIEKRSIDNGVYLAPRKAIEIFKELKGFKVANIANNHFSQHGIESAKYSFDVLEKEGILVVGKDSTPVTIELNERNIKMWGVSLISDKHFCNQYFKSSYESLISDLALSGKGANEFWIISIHWGEEYLTLENNKQKELAELLSKQGFDLVLGHHPHVVQPVVKIENSWIAFSHGNFIFDQNFSKLTQRGLIFNYNLVGNEPKLLFSYQNNFAVKKVSEVSLEEFNHFCRKNFHQSKPILMRILMKVELITHFFELDKSVVRTFFKRLLKKL